ncbi:beta-glucosidase 12-like [Olea europaea subsp. europaea]|uniref:Beta-glucosidase 12-like n=1 Tax=Olea europaea subsp. europaea TaxID=158383 RepID=A0A8S0RH26_OLEEU|nr:beta-glucosidase 12-like [Olea europaea subsp. europaea]
MERLSKHTKITLVIGVKGRYEGAAEEDGRGPSIWDDFTHKYPGKIVDHSNGDLANDFYHRYKEDVKLMEFIGLNAFRFSISWSRILPHGKLSKGINKEGIAFYNNLINELLSKGIQPFPTLFHWDLPQALEDEYGGFLSPRIVDDFRDFADVCFKEFGDRVKHWVTMNEPYIFTLGGYDLGKLAPGRCSPWMTNGCPDGNSATEPYIVAHVMLLCHAQTVELYREKYKASQKGQIGIVLISFWFVPYSKSQADVRAAKRALDFMYGCMRTLVGDRLPNFTDEEANLVKGSYDFLGLNYYTSFYAADLPSANLINISMTSDSNTNLTSERNGKFIGNSTGIPEFRVYPRGLKDLLIYTKQKYKNPSIYITECGMSEANITTIDRGTNDPQRIRFYRRHLLAVRQAIREGVDVRGFFPWSLLDNFEWNSGYNQKFGLIYVDRANELKRYVKKSALWFKKFLN